MPESPTTPVDGNGDRGDRQLIDDTRQLIEESNQMTARAREGADASRELRAEMDRQLGHDDPPPGAG